MYICIHIYLHELCGCTCVYVYICIHIYAICVRDIHTHDHYHHLRHKHESLSKIQKLHLHELADSQLWTRARGWTWNRANKKKWYRITQLFRCVCRENFLPHFTSVIFTFHSPQQSYVRLTDVRLHTSSEAASSAACSCHHACRPCPPPSPPIRLAEGGVRCVMVC